MRTETGVSSGTTASSDWEENTDNKTRIQVAKTIVKTVVAGAVDTLEKVRSYSIVGGPVEEHFQPGASSIL